MSAQQMKTSDNMEQIRQLLFGEQIEQFHSQISDLQKQVSALKTKLDKTMNDLKDEIARLRSDNTTAVEQVEGRLQSTRKEFTAALKAAETHLQEALQQVKGDSVARVDLANYLRELGERLHKGEILLSHATQDGENVRNE